MKIFISHLFFFCVLCFFLDTYGQQTFTNYQAANLVIGQSGFTTVTGSCTQSSTHGPAYCSISSKGVLAVANQTGRRVQLWSNPITSNGQLPNVVIGESNFTNCDGGSSQSLMGGINGLAFSPDGNKLIVTDFDNNRVLIWNSIPTTNGKAADVVIGQVDFTSNTSGTSVSKLYNPTGVFVSPNGKLVVAEYSNNRVLIWNSIPTTNGAPADVVVGQPNFTSSTSGNAANRLDCPWGVWVSSDGKLLISDYDNHRVLIYNSIPTTNNASADVVIGQTAFGTSTSGTSATKLYWPTGVTVSPDGKLAICEFANNRILIYNTIPTSNGAAANVVLGQPDFGYSSVFYPSGIPTDKNMKSAYNVCFDLYGRLFVVGRDMNRGMVFGTIPSQQADLQIQISASSINFCPGASTTQTVTVTNNGPNTATGVIVAVSLPASFTYNSSTASTGTYSSSTSYWNISSLASGESATLSVDGTSSVSGVFSGFSNIVQSNQLDNNLVNNSASITYNVNCPCSGTPIAGTAVSSENPICSGTVFTLSLSGISTTDGGFTYQWQSSSDGTTYTNISGATSPTYANSQTASTYYRCKITCSYSGLSSYSIALYETMDPTCYCIPTFQVACLTSQDFINSFTFSTFTASDAGCNGNSNNYIYYNIPTVEVARELTYPFSIQSGSSYGQNFGIWIDYNKDGDFGEANEFVFYTTSSSTLLITGNITIPSTASEGITRMRVRSNFSTALIPSDDCSHLNYGETEDYNITIAVYCSSSAENTADDDIGNVTFAGINNGTAEPATNNNTAFNTYTDYTTSVLPADVTQGDTLPMSVTQINSATFYPCRINVYIDFNDNGNFDIGQELVMTGITTALPGGNTLSGNVIIPFLTDTGLVRMRVILTEIYGQYGTAEDPSCGFYPWGETEDYLVRIHPGGSCITPPFAGTAVSSDTLVCSSTPFTLSLQYATGGSGQTFQWQKSLNNILWTNCSTLSVFTTTQSESSAYYRCIITCSGLKDTSEFIHVSISSTDCYCIPIVESSCWSIHIDDFILNTLQNNNSGCSLPSGYTNYPPEGNNTTTLYTGNSYSFSLLTAPFYGNGKAIYIDLNSNGSFSDAGEMLYASPYSSGNGSGTITIPNNAAFTGQKRLRVMINNEGAFTSSNNCDNITFGEVEDYTVTIKQGSPCTTPATPRIVVASESVVCPSQIFYLDIQGADSLGIGQTYQWQSSSNNVVWSHLNNNHSVVQYQLTQQTANYYRCITTCSGINDISAVVYVGINNFVDCYCASAANDSSGSDIGNVTFSNINCGNATPVSNNPNSFETYTDYTSTVAPAVLKQGEVFPISIAQISSSFYLSNCKIGVYIDYNHDAVFDPITEKALTIQSFASTGSNLVIGYISVPVDADTGITRMRIVLTSDNNFPGPCGNYNDGETEDYLVTILEGSPCISPPAAGTVYAISDEVCIYDPFTLYLSGSSGGMNQTYQWQYSPDSITWSKIVGAIYPFCEITSQDSSTYYRCNITCGLYTSTTPAFQIKNYPNYLCYCRDHLHEAVCSATDNIQSVSITSTPLQNNNTGCTGYDGNAYSAYPDAGFTFATLQRGQQYELNVTTSDTSIISAWIDFNQDAIFDSIEYIQVSGSALPDVQASVLFTVPAYSLVGKTIMRIRCKDYRERSSLEGYTACDLFNSGETEDYFLHIDTALGIANISAPGYLELYPNPARDKFNVFFADPETKKVQLLMISITGVELLNEKYDVFTGVLKKEFNIGDEAKGIYILQIITDNGVITRKVIFD